MMILTIMSFPPPPPPPRSQYYYSVRVFAGQEVSGVWVGWITPDYHQYDPHFDLTKVRNVTVTVGDDKGNIHDRYCIVTIIILITHIVFIYCFKRY